MPSARRIANIAVNDAMILPYDANPGPDGIFGKHTMWPISTRVNKPENDDPSLLDRVGDPFEVWAPLDWRAENMRSA
jgi:hypothetical protein